MLEKPTVLDYKKYIRNDEDGPVLEFDGELHYGQDNSNPLFVVPDKFARTPFSRIHIKNARIVPSDHEQLFRYAGTIYVDHSVIFNDKKLSDKIIISNSLVVREY
ncbi:MAG: hypothetical protein GPJ54_19015 [Candidatus Heimdallarchaeota archaeon]|nr:hypothetical protein [Candidatus Heimdallarchaeota archaeon]